MHPTRGYIVTAFALAALVFASPGGTVHVAHAKTATQAANAAAGWDRCPANSLCLFEGTDGTGNIAWFRLGSPDLRRQSMDNRASSVWNRHTDAFQLTDDYNYEGECWSIFPGAKGSLDSFDNRASAVGHYACG